MPIIYLSPSTQEGNPYITGSGSEETNMNLLADAMVPYLLSNGIRYHRNRPEMSAATSIREANRGWYDLYLALHSNASGPGGIASPIRGIIAFYYPGSNKGEMAAEIFARNLRDIYPLPGLVRSQATTALGEVRQPNFPAVLLEMGYHDNYSDAIWVESNLDKIAQNLVLSLTEYFGLPFVWPMLPREGTADVDWGTLNLRAKPEAGGEILANMPDGAKVRIFGEWNGWYVVHYGTLVGYAAAQYIRS